MPDALITQEHPTLLFCVIVLVFNDLPHCLSAIESVLEQSESNFELVIIDNGSTDETRTAIEKYLDDTRVRIERYAFNQRSEATQTVAASTEAKYLSFLFADDLYDRSRLEHAAKILEQNQNFGYVFFNNKFQNELGEPIANKDVPPRTQYSGDISAYDRFGHLRYAMERGSTLHPCGMVVRTAIYNELRGFPNTMHRIGDMAFFARLLGAYDGHFAKDAMQTITVWTGGRNESTRNAFQDNEIAFERAIILERWLEPGILNNLERIFSYRQSVGMKLRGRSERLWFLAHQVLKCHNPEYQLFGFRLLHAAADEGDSKFDQEVLSLTGYSPCQYIQTRLLSETVYNFYPTSAALEEPSTTENRNFFSGKKSGKLEGMLKLAPPTAVREVGKLMSTLGFVKIGARLWDDAIRRGAPHT